MRPPTKAQLASWVKIAWDSLTVEMIVKSFKVCGVTLKTDNSENDKINVYKTGNILCGNLPDFTQRCEALERRLAGAV